MAAKAAWLRGAGRVLIVDTLQYRLDMAKKAANAETILWEENGKNAIEAIRAATEGRGADVCIEKLLVLSPTEPFLTAQRR